MIKIPNKTRLADPGTTGVQVSLGATAAEANAFMGIGQALGAAGDKLLDFSNKMARAHNLQQVSEAELDWGGLEAQFTADLQGDQSPESWLGRFDDVIDQAKTLNSGRKLSPEAETIFNAKFNEWQVKAKGKIGIQAASFKIQQARESAYIRADMAVQTGEFETANEIYDSMADAGLDSPARIDKARQDMQRNHEKSRIESTLFGDPSTAEEAVESAETLTEGEKNTYRRQIRTNQNRTKGEYAEDKAYEMSRGKIFTKEEIEADVEAGLMEKDDAARFLSAIQRAETDVDWPTFGSLEEKAIAYDPTQDPEWEQFKTLTQEFRASGLPESRMRQLLSTLEHSRTLQKSNPAASSNLTAVTSFLRKLATPQGRNSGQFGAKKDIRGNYDMESVKQSEIKLAKARQDFIEWQKTEGVNATRPEAMTWILNHLDEDANKTGAVRSAQVLRTGTFSADVPADVTDEELNFLLEGSTVEGILTPPPIPDPDEDPFEERAQFDSEGLPQY